MFLIFIDELVHILASLGIIVKVFADYFKLLIIIINEVDVTTLQEVLYCLFKWAEVWQLSLSLDKCVLYLRLAEPAVWFSLGGVNLHFMFYFVETWVLLSPAICHPRYMYTTLLLKSVNDLMLLPIQKCLSSYPSLFHLCPPAR